MPSQLPPIVAVVVAVVLVGVAGGLVGLRAQEQPPPPVEVDPVQESEIAPTISVLGTVEARRSSTVAASIEGYVIEYLVDEGMAVKRGEVLARLRDDILQLQLTSARSALEEIEERHRKAVRDLERATSLIVEDAITQKQLEDATTEERVLALGISQARASVEILESDIAKKVVTAPFDGEIVREETEVGEWLSRGGPVARLVDLSSVYVRVNVPESTVRFVRRGREVSVSAPAAREEPFVGTVVSIAGEGFPESRTFPVRVILENQDGQLRAAMGARVSLPSGTSRTGLTVSKDALLEQGGRISVFVVREGRAERQEIKTGVAVGGRVEVRSGLEVGDLVVIRGNERIQPGPVRVVNGSSTGGTPGS